MNWFINKSERRNKSRELIDCITIRVYAFSELNVCLICFSSCRLRCSLFARCLWECFYIVLRDGFRREKNALIRIASSRLIGTTHLIRCFFFAFEWSEKPIQKSIRSLCLWPNMSIVCFWCLDSPTKRAATKLEIDSTAEWNDWRHNVSASCASHTQ